MQDLQRNLELVKRLVQAVFEVLESCLKAEEESIEAIKEVCSWVDLVENLRRSKSVPSASYLPCPTTHQKRHGGARSWCKASRHSCRKGCKPCGASLPRRSEASKAVESPLSGAGSASFE